MTLTSALRIKFVKLALIVVVVPLILFSGTIAMAQSQQLDEKLMALKQSQATNKAEARAVHLAGNRNRQRQRKCERY